ncbi:hypothetical protein QTG54_012960 [Skeletonema marinoi]|uniref:Uncharacterized protein n=1 Tax=Skeletonema marinoi TaxID=267567 RepID=A0AAD8XZL6_9STRA|nr:hypothetical protein QTG54_012960 [Skeletonema marinoi]
MSRYTSRAILLAAAMATASAFAPSGVTSRISSELHLDNHIADMIDHEVDRLQNIGLWRQKEAEKHKKWAEMEPSLPKGFDFNTVTEFQPNSDAAKKIQMRKDRRMARDDPMRYCADRCVSTGNCQVWEDMFDLSAKEVMAFCEECVLSEEEEPCDVPEKFLDNAGKNSWELRP